MASGLGGRGGKAGALGRWMKVKKVAFTEVNRHDLFNCALVPSRNRKLRLTAVSHRAAEPQAPAQSRFTQRCGGGLCPCVPQKSMSPEAFGLVGT